VLEVTDVFFSGETSVAELKRFMAVTIFSEKLIQALKTFCCYGYYENDML
jgi:hypothetical protein